METIENNTSIDNALFRDAFLGGSGEITGEGIHTRNLIASLMQNNRTSAYDLTMTSPKVYFILKNKIITSHYKDQQKFKAVELLKHLMNIKLNAKNLPNLYYVDNDSKVVLCDNINDCVELGLFNENEMVAVENLMCLLLNSIVDVQIIDELEM